MRTPEPIPIGQDRQGPLDAVRSSVTVLVVLHHALLAWHPYAPPPFGTWNAPPFLWQAFPVVDRVRAPGSEWLAGLNDTFFMALMFLVAGCTVVGSLERRGGTRFVAARALRLGVPFVLSALLLAPLAYFTAWLLRGGEASLSAYGNAWLGLGHWPIGPAWFLAVLFAFSLLTAVVWRYWRRLPDLCATASDGLTRRPWRLACALIGVALVTYLPMVHATDPMSWWTWGPFTVQSSRVLLYAGFFGLGLVLGRNSGTLLAHDGLLARRWWLWLPLAAGCWWLHSGWSGRVFVAWFSGQTPATDLVFKANASFAVSCGLLALAWMAVIARFSRTQPGAVAASLTRNAYGIFLLHYVIVLWLQYLLLPATALNGWSKLVLAALGGLLLSWTLTAMLRRLPGVARVL